MLLLKCRVRKLIINYKYFGHGVCLKGKERTFNCCLQAYRRPYPDIKTTNYYDQIEI